MRAGEEEEEAGAGFSGLGTLTKQRHRRAKAGGYICHPTKTGRKMLCCRETTRSRCKCM